MFKKNSVKITQKMVENCYKLNNKRMSFTLPSKDGGVYVVDCEIRKVQKIYGKLENFKLSEPTWYD